MTDYEETSLDPLAILIVTGADPDLRGDLIDAIRAMDDSEDRDLAVIPGDPESLDGDLDRVLAMEDVTTLAIELDGDDPALVLDAVEPLIEDEAAILIGVLDVVDAAGFWSAFREGDAAIARQLVSRIEAASLVVLAATDEVPAEEPSVEGFVRNLNPMAAVLPISGLEGLSLPELAEAIAKAEAADEAPVDPDDEPLAGEVDAWGFNSFTWTTETLLDRGRFMALFENWPLEVLRAHGVVRFEDGATAVLSVVRDSVALDEYGGDDDGHEHEHEDHDHDHDHDHGDEVLLGDDEDVELGDNESELAFVGRDLPVSALVGWLEACQVE